MRIATLAAVPRATVPAIVVITMLVGLSSAEAQTTPKVGNQLTRAEMKKLQPGLFVVVYPRHSSQIDKYGAFVEQADLGEPVQAPGNPYVINQIHDWKFPAEFNAIATGLLRIDTPGEYRFNVNTTWDRGSLAVDGKMICPYRDGENTIATIQLEKGYHTIMTGGYYAAGGSVRVLWQPPGAQALQPIPSELLSFIPPDPKKKK